MGTDAPGIGYGHIFAKVAVRITSRARIARRDLAIQQEGNRRIAGKLLRRATQLSEDEPLETVSAATRTAAQQLVEELDGLPLALDQAGAYIEETGCGLSEYLALYGRHRLALLKGESSMVSDYPHTVASTWTLSFSQVEQADPAAADLLRLCAFLQPDAIPEEILTEGAAALGPHLQEVATERLRLNEVMQLLRRYSLVKRDAEARLLHLHRLVQVVLKESLDPPMQRQWAERALLAVNAVFPRVEHETWPKCERLLAQALTAAQLIEQYQIVSEEAGRLLHETATYLCERARYTEAEPLYQQALRIREQQVGPEHPDIATSLDGLANLYRMQGKYAEAEPFYQLALAINEQQLGPEHPSTATSLNSLAVLYFNQGKDAEAESLYQRALAINEKVLGPEHPSTAGRLNNLAMLYTSQGKYAEAEPLYQRALRILEHQFGLENPDAAETIHSFARYWEVQNNKREASVWYTRALAVREQALGAHHPKTSETRTRLIALLHSMDQHEDAAQLEAAKSERRTHEEERKAHPEE